MNDKIRRLAKGNGVPFWKICEEMNISEPTFTRLMRKPLEQDKESLIIEIIERLSQEKGEQ